MKEIRRWKSGMDAVQATQFLQEMAEQGYVLKDMNHLWYVFREEEPTYLQYRLETRAAALSEEERTAYAVDGWQEVCHYELEYVFAKERDLFAEETDSNLTKKIAESLDQKIETEQKEERFHRRWELTIVVLAIGVVLLLFGFSEKGIGLARNIFLRYVPLLLLAFLLSKRSIGRMQREKEEVLAGDIPEKYTDWRRSHRTVTTFVVVLVIGFGGWAFYQCGFHEKTIDLPKKISYAEIPAVRLENLTEEPLTRAGESIDPEMEGVRLNANMGEGSRYEIQKEMGGFENYAVDYRWLLKTEKKLETRQCMQTEDGTELHLDTMYERYRSEDLAEKAYLEGVLTEGTGWTEMEKLSPDTDAFYDLFVARMDGKEKSSYHVICRWENQLMELDYTSSVELDLERLLAEAERVFAAQQEN